MSCHHKSLTEFLLHPKTQLLKEKWTSSFEAKDFPIDISLQKTRLEFPRILHGVDRIICLGNEGSWVGLK